MVTSSMRRAATAAVALVLVASGVAFADTAPADADTDMADVQTSRHLGEVAPGATVTVDIDVTLRCGNSWHVERGSTITVDATVTAPLDGTAVVTPGSIGPVPDDWPLDGEYCPGGTGVPSLAATTPVSLALTAPSAVGTGYEYTVLLLFSPDTGISGLSAVSFTLDVVEPEPTDTTPPVLAGVPSGIAVTTPDPAGAAVSWPAPTATDDTDAAPVVACLPVSGSVFAVGPTTVTCTATDASGNAASASFVVTVAYAPPVAVAWEAPLGTGTPALVANRGRVVPVKVALAFDGAPIGALAGGVGPVLRLERLAACGEAVVASGPDGRLGWDGKRWSLLLDTGALAAGCWRLTVAAGGTSFGSVELLVVDGPVGMNAAANRAR